jgi:hypothetical protein
VSDAATSEAPRDPWIRFTLIFAALAVLSELVYYGVALESAWFRDYLAAVARVSGWLLSHVVDGVQVNGTAVTSGVFSVEIGPRLRRLPDVRTAHRGDRGIPRARRLKVWGIALGLLWLNLWNFVRIVGLFLHRRPCAQPLPAIARGLLSDLPDRDDGRRLGPLGAARDARALWRIRDARLSPCTGSPRRRSRWRCSSASGRRRATPIPQSSMRTPTRCSPARRAARPARGTGARLARGNRHGDARRRARGAETRGNRRSASCGSDTGRASRSRAMLLATPLAPLRRALAVAAGSRWSICSRWRGSASRSPTRATRSRSGRAGRRGASRISAARRLRVAHRDDPERRVRARVLGAARAPAPHDRSLRGARVDRRSRS